MRPQIVARGRRIGRRHWLRYRARSSWSRALVADRYGGTDDRCAGACRATGGSRSAARTATCAPGTAGSCGDVSTRSSRPTSSIRSTRRSFCSMAAAPRVLPVTFVRGRVMPSERLTIEGVVVPVFRRGTFDELDEPTSPFNLVRDAGPAGDVVGRGAGHRADRRRQSTWSNRLRRRARVGDDRPRGRRRPRRIAASTGSASSRSSRVSAPVPPAAGTAVPAVVGRLVERFRGSR